MRSKKLLVFSVTLTTIALVLALTCYVKCGHCATITNTSPATTSSKRVPLTNDTPQSVLDQAINMQGVTEGEKIQHQNGIIVIEKGNDNANKAPAKKKPLKNQTPPENQP